MIRKIIYNLFLLVIFILILLILILSTVGIDTDKFNKLITNKIAESKNIDLKLKTVNFKLDLGELSLFIETLYFLIEKRPYTIRTVPFS